MSRPSAWVVVAASVAACAVLVPSAAPAPARQTATLLAVGDVASCNDETDELVAALVARTPGTVALLGDLVYDSGTADEFARCFMPAWGRIVPRIRPALGNHDYANGASDAAAARSIFRLPAHAWYSYELGAWHVIVLNSTCAEVRGCHVGSRQWLWLKHDLARHRKSRCTVAYWHQARWSSGEHGSDATFAPFWSLLSKAGADVVLSGHDHDYERFAPIAGIRSFVVGTGGRGLRAFGTIHPRSVARQAESFGVLRLTLRPRGYSWRFLTASGPEYGDAGSATCR
jgi:acid phosphatase type 7